MHKHRTAITRNNLKPSLLVFIALFTLGLFVGGPQYYDNSIVRESWESGHFLLFLFAAFYLFTYSKLNRIEAMKRSVIILGVLLLAGFLTEALQLLVGRNFEMKDVLNDMLGAFAGLLIPWLRAKNNTGRFILLVTVFVCLVVFSQRSLLHEVVRVLRLQQDFPVLSDFESSYQLERWGSDLARLSLSESNVRNGKFSMRVDLSPGKYPGITLKRLRRNWEGYQFIGFSIYLDAEYPVDFVIKVYDRQHPDSGYDNQDRFNGRLQLHPGWNDILLPLHLIARAPAERSMNMKQIVSLSLFTVNLKHDTIFYLDSLQLIKE